MKNLKLALPKYIKITVMLVIIVYFVKILIVIYEVYNIKDINIASIDIEYSENSTYKLRTVNPFDSNIPDYLIVSSTETDEILTIDTIPYLDMQARDAWRYGAYRHDDYILGYGNILEDNMDDNKIKWDMWVKLPPSLLQKFKTYLAVNIRGYKYPKSTEEYFEEKMLFVKNGGDVNAKDHYGKTTLMYVDHFYYYNRDKDNSDNILKFLIENGADLTIVDEDGNTALLRASERDNLEIVKLLVKNGADINARDRLDKTALDLTKTGSIKKYLESLK